MRRRDWAASAIASERTCASRPGVDAVDDADDDDEDSDDADDEDDDDLSDKNPSLFLSVD